METMASLETLATCGKAVIYLAGQPGSAVMSPTPYKPAYQIVVDAIRDQIRSGLLKPGGKLPIKRELIAQYSVSGQVIDSAMLILRTTGWVEGRQGKGVYVAASPPIE
jgi:GntR family transcriptional regulator